MSLETKNMTIGSLDEDFFAIEDIYTQIQKQKDYMVLEPRQQGRAENIRKKIIKSIQNKTPLSFSKFGDGEYLCVFDPSFIANCDNDVYTVALSNGLKEVFTGSCIFSDHYFGLWHDPKKQTRWLESLPEEIRHTIKWADYHTLIMSGNAEDDKEVVEVYRAIKQSTLPKIMVSNHFLMKADKLLGIDFHEYIPLNNWYDTKFAQHLGNVSSYVEYKLRPNSPFIMITCCGMSAKPFIYKMKLKFPHGIYLDVGSGLDRICTHVESRGWKFSDEYLYNMWKDLLPDNWDEPGYQTLYSSASNILGQHLFYEH